ncbi:MAG: hydrogenase accessory protein HypB, partial [Kiritimatiellia bacterium]
MCETCGCSDDQHVRITRVTRGQTDHAVPPHDHAHSPSHDHDHKHGHDHDHGHNHGHSHGTTVSLEEDLLAKNNLLAQRNRGWFEGRGILALNL